MKGEVKLLAVPQDKNNTVENGSRARVSGQTFNTRHQVRVNLSRFSDVCQLADFNSTHSYSTCVRNRFIMSVRVFCMLSWRASTSFPGFSGELVHSSRTTVSRILSNYCSHNTS